MEWIGLEWNKIDIELRRPKSALWSGSGFIGQRILHGNQTAFFFSSVSPKYCFFIFQVRRILNVVSHEKSLNLIKLEDYISFIVPGLIDFYLGRPVSSRIYIFLYTLI